MIAVRPQNSQHLLRVVRQRSFAAGRETANRQRQLPFERLLDLDVPGLFQLVQMAGEITLREPAFPLQIEEVGLGSAFENHEDLQTRRLMDKAVELGDILDAIVHA